MNILTAPQKSTEWWAFKVGKISGTRFGQATSSRDNRLLYDLLNEKLNGYIVQDEYESDEMRFGTENEPVARQLYSEQSGFEFEEVGAIISDFSDIHMASPDGLNSKLGIVLEIKCTMNGAIHIQRFVNGPESSYMPQIINYFAVSDEVKEVHWVSYCPYRAERQLVIVVFTRDSLVKDGKKQVTIGQLAEEGREAVSEAAKQLIELEQAFIF